MQQYVSPVHSGAKSNSYILFSYCGVCDSKAFVIFSIIYKVFRNLLQQFTGNHLHGYLLVKKDTLISMANTYTYRSVLKPTPPRLTILV